MSQELILRLLREAEQRLEALGENLCVRKRVFHVMVEMLQNVGEDAVLMVDRKHDRYSIVSGNPVRNEDVDSLKNALKHISDLDKRSLNQLYQEILTTKKFSDKGGAGLGLIDIARRSIGMTWKFVPIDACMTFFYLKVDVSSYHAKNGYIQENQAGRIGLPRRILFCSDTACA